MKRFLPLLLPLLFCVRTEAQSKGTVKLYGYRQSVSGGKGPERSSEGVTTGERTGTNYFLYAVSATRIYPSEVWVEGVRYGVSIKTVLQTPVEYGDETNIGSAKKTLVPKTGQKVIQLELRPAASAKTSGTKAKSLAAGNQLVLVYKQAGTFRYNTLTALKDMDGATMQ